MIGSPRLRLRYLLARRPKTWGAVTYGPGIEDAIERGLAAAGFAVEPFRVDPAAYRQYLARARYDRFPQYYAWRASNFNEKALEHFVALTLLELEPGDVYLDIASSGSPTPEIYADLTGAESWRQDLDYAAGVHGRAIGGDAAALPLPDGFAAGMALHCSFEHFEGDSDIRFVREAARVLRPGGRLIILPLYLFTHYAIQTDPTEWRGWRPPFAPEPGARLHFARGWRNRHGRFYDPERLQERVAANLGPLRLTLYRVTNADEIDPGCYLRFVAKMEKSPEPAG